MTRRPVSWFCSRVTSGGTPPRSHSEYFEHGDIPWLRTQDLLDMPISQANEAITSEGLSHSSAKLYPIGTVLVAMYGATAGRLGWLNFEASTNQAIAGLEVDSNRADFRWLYYALKWSREDLINRVSGAAQQNLNISTIKSHLLPGVPVERQRDIGILLGTLDDKIAANRRIISTSDELRTTLWMQATKDGDHAVPLSSIASFVNGRAFTKDATGTGRVVIRIADLNSGIGASTVYNDVEAVDDNLARPGDFLMAWSGSLTTARWFRDEALINQHIFKVIPRDEYPLWAVACAVEAKMPEFKAAAADKATTMGHIKRENLDEPALWPTLTPELDQIGSSLWQRSLAAEMENESLARTRDELLPLLMSGKITVKDAERTVEEVA